MGEISFPSSPAPSSSFQAADTGTSPSIRSLAIYNWAGVVGLVTEWSDFGKIVSHEAQGLVADAESTWHEAQGFLTDAASGLNVLNPVSAVHLNSHAVAERRWNYPPPPALHGQFFKSLYKAAGRSSAEVAGDKAMLADASKTPLVKVTGSAAAHAGMAATGNAALTAVGLLVVSRMTGGSPLAKMAIVGAFGGTGMAGGEALAGQWIEGEVNTPRTVGMFVSGFTQSTMAARFGVKGFGEPGAPPLDQLRDGMLGHGLVGAVIGGATTTVATFALAKGGATDRIKAVGDTIVENLLVHAGSSALAHGALHIAPQAVGSAVSNIRATAVAEVEATAAAEAGASLEEIKAMIAQRGRELGAEPGRSRWSVNGGSKLTDEQMAHALHQAKVTPTQARNLLGTVESSKAALQPTLSLDDARAIRALAEYLKALEEPLACAIPAESGKGVQVISNPRDVARLLYGLGIKSPEALKENLHLFMRSQ